MSRLFVYPKLGRAGLGNELFAVLRAHDAALIARGSVRVVPPRWGRVRLGPWLRGERDARQYWRLFRRPSLRYRILRALIDNAAWSARAHIGPYSLRVEEGMRDYFTSLTNHPGVYRAYLGKIARPGVIASPTTSQYIAMHVRLGDFQRANDDRADGSRSALVVEANNHGTPLWWFVDMAEEIRRRLPKFEIVVCSDGSDEELKRLLAIDGVRRSAASNALDDIMTMASAVGLVGSRSTFTAWGAFLGDGLPLVVAPGGNAYKPHCQVWEVAMAEDLQYWARAVVGRVPG